MSNPVITNIVSTLIDEYSKYTGKEALRLIYIIGSLQRFNQGKLDHPDDLTVDEKKDLAQENLTTYMRNLYTASHTSCEQLRHTCDDAGTDDYFYDFKEQPRIPGVDFETFRNFIRSTQCLCGNCNSKSEESESAVEASLNVEVYDSSKNLFRDTERNLIMTIISDNVIVVGALDDTTKQIRQITEDERSFAKNKGLFLLDDHRNIKGARK